MTTDRTYTHVIVYNDGWAPLALTKAEARSVMRSMRNGYRTDVAAIYTYNHVRRQYVAADRSATRADKTLRGMWCGGWREWSAAREELWADRSNAAHAKLEKYGPLLSILEGAEQKVEVA